MICACGKAKMDGIKCKLGASHMTLEASRAHYRTLNPHLPVDYWNHVPGKPKTKTIERERLPIKRERLPIQRELF